MGPFNNKHLSGRALEDISSILPLRTDRMFFWLSSLSSERKVSLHGRASFSNSKLVGGGAEFKLRERGLGTFRAGEP